MEVSTYPTEEGYIVDVKGDLTADQRLAILPATVERVLSEKSPAAVAVRVRDVEVADLEGIAVLVHAWKAVTDRGVRFALIDGKPRVRRRLEQTGLLHLLEHGNL